MATAELAARALHPPEARKAAHRQLGRGLFALVLLDLSNAVYTGSTPDRGRGYTYQRLHQSIVSIHNARVNRIQHANLTAQSPDEQARHQIGGELASSRALLQLPLRLLRDPSIEESELLHHLLPVWMPMLQCSDTHVSPRSRTRHETLHRAAQTNPDSRICFYPPAATCPCALAPLPTKHTCSSYGWLALHVFPS